MLPEASLNREELRRYHRHLSLPEIGAEGQKKIKQAKVLCIGVGGLGSPLAYYLAAAGVGRLGLVDFDVVDASDLQRQILYSTEDVGKPKLAAARGRLKALNPHIEVVPHEGRLTSDGALDLFPDYDIIADCTDNFPARYLINDACVSVGRPDVYGGIFRFDGQASVFGVKGGPCYRCLHPEPPPPDAAPSCAETGVLGVLPGMIGIIQAAEVLKLVLGLGRPLVGRLLWFNALDMEWRAIRINKNPSCPSCSGPDRN